MITRSPLKLTNDEEFFCDLCDYKCHGMIYLKAHKQEKHTDDSDEEEIPKKRIKIQITTSSEGFITKTYSKNGEIQTQDAVKLEKVDESAGSSGQKPKFSLKGLLNKSNLKIVSSVKLFNCAKCKQVDGSKRPVKNFHSK